MSIVFLLGTGLTFAQKRKTIERPQQTSVSKNGMRTNSRSNAGKQTPARKTTPVFSISSTYADFGASGGTKYFTVNSTNSWKISVGTASWGHLQRNGNRLTLRVDENTSSYNRTDYFDIANGKKTIRVNISQDHTRTLSVSTSELNFSSSGGSQTITVTASDSWEIGTKPYSWGHLNISGNQLTLTVDANNSKETRTDYFTVKSGGLERRINVTQSSRSSSTWSMSGTTRAYTDEATALPDVTKTIKEWGECRLGSITENGSAVVVYGKNGYSCKKVNTYLINKIKEINNAEQRIKSVTITNSGYYCVVYERNGWYGNVPENMKTKLNEFNNATEDILSVSICENGNFTIVTDKHFYASNTTDYNNIIKARDLYGRIKDVCVTNKGISVVCEKGVYYSNVPTKLKEKLESISFKPDHIAFTDSGTCLITNENGTYTFWM